MMDIRWKKDWEEYVGTWARTDDHMVHDAEKVRVAERAKVHTDLYVRYGNAARAAMEEAMITGGTPCIDVEMDDYNFVQYTMLTGYRSKSDPLERTAYEMRAFQGHGHGEWRDPWEDSKRFIRWATGGRVSPTMRVCMRKPGEITM